MDIVLVAVDYYWCLLWGSIILGIFNLYNEQIKMKQSKIYFSIALIMAALALITWLTSCNNSAGSGGNVVRRDTIPVFALHMGYGFNSVKMGRAKKVTIHDTLMWVGKDSLTQKKEPADSVYYLVEMEVMTDSIIAKEYQIPEFDTAGKRYVVTIGNIPLPPIFVREAGVNYDSAVNHLRNFIPKPDTSQIKK